MFVEQNFTQGSLTQESHLEIISVHCTLGDLYIRNTIKEAFKITLTIVMTASTETPTVYQGNFKLHEKGICNKFMFIKRRMRH